MQKDPDTNGVDSGAEKAEIDTRVAALYRLYTSLDKT